MSEDHALQEEVVRLRLEIESLRKALEDAIECIEGWAAYADDYFKRKHDLAGDLKRLRGYLDRAG